MADSEPLEDLAQILSDRGWTVDMRPTGDLQVTNPHAGLTERVRCRDGHIMWQWGLKIGPVNELERVADTIAHVLRGVGS